jgi:hypothetical protein
MYSNIHSTSREFNSFLASLIACDSELIKSGFNVIRYNSIAHSRLHALHANRIPYSLNRMQNH